MRPVLVLRPEPGASATAARARQMGLDTIAVPLFEIEPVDWEAPDRSAFDGLLLTSANAMRYGGTQLQRLAGLPVYAVGEATAEAARDLGLKVVGAGNGGVDKLLASIEPRLKLLHLCGAERRTPERASQQITPVIVYRSREVEAPDLTAAPGSIALIHSPLAGARFAELVRERSSIAIVAISAAAADAVGDEWESVQVAERPSDDALLALAASLCNKPDPE